MGRWPVWLLVGLAALASGEGCANTDKCCRNRGPELSDKPEMVLPAAARTPLEPLFLALPVPPPPGVPGEPPPAYKALTAQDCLCRAAQEVSLARMLDSEADAVAEQDDRGLLSCSQRSRCVAALKADVFHGTSAELRNLAAGAALTLFYRLAEAEALADLLQESIGVLGEALSHAQDLQNKGLRGGEDAAALQRQLSDVLADRLRLQMSIDDANIELNRMLNLDLTSCSCKGRFWPVFELHFQPQPPDCDKAVAEALAKRPELFVLRRLGEEMTVENLPLLRKVLQSVNGLLGVAGPAPCPLLTQLRAMLCGTGRAADELRSRRQQLEEYQAGRVRAISADVLQDVSSLCRQAQLVALARAKARNWERRVEELRALQTQGRATFGEVAEARQQWLKARGDAIKEVMAWERFLVRLHMHQGVLIEHCQEGPALPKVEPLPVPPQALPPEPASFSSRLGQQLSGTHGPE